MVSSEPCYYSVRGRKMSAIPVAASLIVGMVSGITLLAVPAHIYSYGVAYLLSIPTFISAAAITFYAFLPVFYELQITTLFTISMSNYLPIVIYIPALALSQATGISINTITPAICTVCIFYTTFGGLKAVIWTDILQFILMLGSIITIFSIGISTSGGFINVWQKNAESRRTAIDFSFDLTNRDTFWSSGIAMSVNWFCYIAVNQGIVQKCISVSNLPAAGKALAIFAVGLIVVVFLCGFTGLIMFSRYSECDPLTSGSIMEPDQLLPHYVMDIARTIPGLSGLFTAGIFSAALSTLAATINCLSATIFKDFVSRFVKKGTSEKAISNYLKMLSVLIGVTCTALVYIVPYLGNILPLVMSLGGISDGATLGIFTCALLLPGVNARGVLVGGIVALIFMAWVVLGSQYYIATKAITYPSLPVSISGCQNITLPDKIFTQINNTFGGLRAVVWTDALQFIVMVAAIIAIVALGFSSDDIENIWNKNYEYGRLDISFSIDVTKRDTFWTATIGNSLIWTTYFMYNQGFVQKCISLPHYKAVRCAIINFAIGVMIIFSLAILTGLLMFAKYWNCDPQLLGKIKQYDQLLPYYVMDIARTIPGLPGLFISGIFSAALSTLSASINCLSASIYEDFIAPHIKKGTSERAITNYLKLLAMLIGALVTLLTYIIPYLGTIQPLAITVGSVTGSTLLGFYTCGMLIPAINAKGALFGGLTSILFVTWIISGAQYYKSVGLITHEPLPIGTGGCQNVTFLNSSVISYSRKTEEAAFVIYRISFYYYTLLGLLVFLLVAFIVSKLTPNCNKRLTKKYFSP
ncbi:Sodium:solute symporter family [Popillia japonica]|uniref:Sodium:solute symporter family n=1 Tax=Popillia japonica TaxID=7064 RepID=A0AAW1KQ18_POPJA